MCKVPHIIALTYNRLIGIELMWAVAYFGSECGIAIRIIYTALPRLYF
jgi:hypothetical protein